MKAKKYFNLAQIEETESNNFNTLIAFWKSEGTVQESFLTRSIRNLKKTRSQIDF